MISFYVYLLLVCFIVIYVTVFNLFMYPSVLGLDFVKDLIRLTSVLFPKQNIPFYFCPEHGFWLQLWQDIFTRSMSSLSIIVTWSWSRSPWYNKPFRLLDTKFLYYEQSLVPIFMWSSCSRQSQG